MAWRAAPVSAAADRWEDGDLVAVAELGEVAGERLVAVHPDARGVQDGGELRAVRRAQVVEQGTERRRGAFVAFVVTASRGFARLREQQDADAQRALPGSGMLVRAVGNASRRSGSMGSPVSSSTP